MFSDTLSKLREVGRAAVLPTETMKKSVTAKIKRVKGNIVDLGAGTQYWSRYLSEYYQTTVLAVDSYYENTKDTDLRQHGGGYCAFKTILNVFMIMQQICFGHVMFYTTWIWIFGRMSIGPLRKNSFNMSS